MRDMGSSCYHFSVGNGRCTITLNQLTKTICFVHFHELYITTTEHDIVPNFYVVAPTETDILLFVLCLSSMKDYNLKQGKHLTRKKKCIHVLFSYQWFVYVCNCFFKQRTGQLLQVNLGLADKRIRPRRLLSQIPSMCLLISS